MTSINDHIVGIIDQVTDANECGLTTGVLDAVVDALLSDPVIGEMLKGWRPISEAPEEIQADAPKRKPKLGDWTTTAMIDYTGQWWVIRYANTTNEVLGCFKVPRFMPLPPEPGEK